MGGIGQNILREIKEDGGNKYKSPTVKELLNKMGKIEKKRKKLQDRIDYLQEEIRISLTKKSSSTAEINVPAHQGKIQELQKKLKEL